MPASSVAHTPRAPYCELELSPRISPGWFAPLGMAALIVSSLTTCSLGIGAGTTGKSGSRVGEVVGDVVASGGPALAGPVMGEVGAVDGLNENIFDPCGGGGAGVDGIGITGA